MQFYDFMDKCITGTLNRTIKKTGYIKRMIIKRIMESKPEGDGDTGTAG